MRNALLSHSEKLVSSKNAPRFRGRALVKSHDTDLLSWMGCEWQECVLAQTESEGLHTKHLDPGGQREQAVSHLI